MGMAAAVAQAPGSVSRPSVMVMNFEFATVSDQLKEKESLGSVIAAFRGQNPNANVEQTKIDLGAGISDMVVERLLEDVDAIMAQAEKAHRSSSMIRRKDAATLIAQMRLLLQ